MSHHGMNDEERVDPVRHADEAQRRSERGNLWEMPALFVLAVVVAWLFGGWRAVGLVVILTVFVAILLLEKIGKAWFAFIVILVAMIVLCLYIFIFYQTL